MVLKDPRPQVEVKSLASCDVTGPKTEKQLPKNPTPPDPKVLGAVHWLANTKKKTLIFGAIFCLPGTTESTVTFPKMTTVLIYSNACPESGGPCV